MKTDLAWIIEHNPNIDIGLYIWQNLWKSVFLCAVTKTRPAAANRARRTNLQEIRDTFGVTVDLRNRRRIIKCHSKTTM